MFSYKNIIVVISSPSGTGKTSIIREVIKRDDNLRFSISATTREPRANEVDGEHYHFIAREEFTDRIHSNDFLEYATVFGNYYGTPMNEIERNFKEKHDIIMDVDWQGARQITARVKKSELIKIFILPPSLEELRIRLKNRNTDSKISIARRMDEAKNEIKHSKEYDYVVVNDNFERVIDDVRSLILAKKIGNTIKSEVRNFIAKLCSC
ncbi:MAG: guanylate kinase [Rickettsiales bacterium]|nr:guanylate kinase [Rickettsiales bacterium]